MRGRCRTARITSLETPQAPPDTLAAVACPCLRALQNLALMTSRPLKAIIRGLCSVIYEVTSCVGDVHQLRCWQRHAGPCRGPTTVIMESRAARLAHFMGGGGGGGGGLEDTGEGGGGGGGGEPGTGLAGAGGGDCELGEAGAFGMKGGLV